MVIVHLQKCPFSLSSFTVIDMHIWTQYKMTEIRAIVNDVGLYHAITSGCQLENVGKGTMCIRIALYRSY